MGNQSSQPVTQLSPLQPFNPPLGVHLNYCAPYPVTLVLKEKAFSFSGDDFAIKDASNGQEVIRCKGKGLSFVDEKVFTDTSGRVLFTLKNEFMALLKHFYAKDATGRQIFTVKSKFSLMGESSLTARFTNASEGSSVVLELKGKDFWDTNSEITFNGRTVARISKDYATSREIFADKQTYYVTVAPGVDLAMMAAIAICLDELSED